MKQEKVIGTVLSSKEAVALFDEWYAPEEREASSYKKLVGQIDGGFRLVRTPDAKKYIVVGDNVEVVPETMTQSIYRKSSRLVSSSMRYLKVKSKKLKERIVTRDGTRLVVNKGVKSEDKDYIK